MDRLSFSEFSRDVVVTVTRPLRSGTVHLLHLTLAKRPRRMERGPFSLDTHGPLRSFTPTGKRAALLLAYTESLQVLQTSWETGTSQKSPVT